MRAGRVKFFVSSLGTLLCLGCGGGARDSATEVGSGSDTGMDAGSTIVGTGAVLTTGAADTTGGTPSATQSGDQTDSSSTGGLEDLPPYPAACEAPQAEIMVTAASSPNGDFQIDQAWVGVDLCTGWLFVELVEDSTLDGGAGMSILVVFDEPGPAYMEPLLGVYPVSFAGSNDPLGTMEILEPLEAPDYGVPDPSKHLHAQIEIHELGWEISVEVGLIDCGVTGCFCACR